MYMGTLAIGVHFLSLFRSYLQWENYKQSLGFPYALLTSLFFIQWSSALIFLWGTFLAHFSFNSSVPWLHMFAFSGHSRDITRRTILGVGAAWEWDDGFCSTISMRVINYRVVVVLAPSAHQTPRNLLCCQFYSLPWHWTRFKAPLDDVVFPIVYLELSDGRRRGERPPLP